MSFVNIPFDLNPLCFTVSKKLERPVDPKTLMNSIEKFLASPKYRSVQRLSNGISFGFDSFGLSLTFRRDDEIELELVKFKNEKYLECHVQNRWSLISGFRILLMLILFGTLSATGAMPLQPLSILVLMSFMGLGLYIQRFFVWLWLKRLIGKLNNMNKMLRS